ncbi:MAG: DUF4129 domain-containing protein [Bacteroidia bacterium]|nr:DUF4129 domain-containing protein [Bacteroidia bacterium]NNF30869.1 DUF4129 domain-containing protein [Flavobacteriaceae bacterium]MBT8275425.1 DUF4129 domain-containing protein [Bacteroidia bacterium]NNJ81936.1 DUF4129 domain-containing protein [Flavobacteriaceae bacterium]NNK54482.1 DUF4129 domain-containing protein [Flavobacteriaceae bacterium]
MRILSLIIFIFLLFAEGKAQDQTGETIKPVVVYDEDRNVEPLDLDENTIDELKKDDDFNYEEIEAADTIWEKLLRWMGEMWDSFWRWLLGDYEAIGFLAFIIKLLPYLIIAGIVFFVIWLFYKLNPGARFLKSKEKPEVFFTEEEEIIRSKNIQELIQKALEDKNFRLAIRYYYLLVLRKLTNAEIITYEFDKTNSEYVSEISSEAISGQFSKVTTLYDYIWYGSFDVTETDFGIAQKSFNTLVQQIPEGHE